MEALVEGVDHVYVPMAEASAGFDVLVEQLGLPVLWPFTSFGTFSSGGVSLGSIKLEIIDSNPETPWSLAHQPPQVQGIALRPARPVDDGYLAEVDRRSLARSAPAHFERDGRPAWTNLYLSDFIGPSAGVFVCDYHLPEPKDLAKRRRLLQECDGGRLGVLDAVGLVIGTRDIGAARERWQRLLEPLAPVGALTWRPAVGPAITLVQGDEERVEHLALAVRSPETARRVWHDQAGTLRGFALRLVAG
ncbi:hypothetical protein [Nocardioides mesophilus]|uniref:Uncharacterized protein n=1 Tax=Nocardioides mesophilus TaxID=433659 RepID=A0A7G9RD55_9ACTN|nr:hypothetical protein [Nocardioides mesophilus]QNN53530.1 hypothetical protein H9L09_03595 [Nocardioides mesophilus]